MYFYVYFFNKPNTKAWIISFYHKNVFYALKLKLIKRNALLNLTRANKKSYKELMARK